MNKLKRRTIQYTSAFIFVIFSTTALAAEKHIVFPTGIFPDDLNNIQWLLDDLGTRGVDGKIILKATNQAGVPTEFNFGSGEIIGAPEQGGERWGIEVRSTEYWGQSGNIQILGETNGPHQTIIADGFESVYVFRQAKFEISGIRFKDAMLAPIVVIRSTDTKITKNIVENVVAEPWGIGDGGAQKGVGIWVVSDVSGKVAIKDNSIDGVFADSGDGIAVVQTNADIEITGNTILNTNRVGILISQSQNSVSIVNNTITPGSGGKKGLFVHVGAGIAYNCGIGPNASLKIVDNEIVTDARFSFGISLEGLYLGVFGGGDVECPVKDTLIEDNRIVMNKGGSALELIASGGRVFNNRILDNKISGRAKWGFFAEGFPFSSGDPFPSDVFNNVFRDNEFSNFVAKFADVLLGYATFDNSYVGHDEYVLDLGSNNSVKLRRRLK